MRCAPIPPSPRPSDDDVEMAVSHVHGLVDLALDALVLLCPDTTRWEVPSASVDRAVWADAKFDRAHRRVREVRDRLRETTAEKHHPDIDDMDEAVSRAMTDAAEVGYRLGMAMARRTTRMDA